MLDFYHLEEYTENNRIEAKKALGGLPKSIWETYSAFANTFGGVILLGVEERKDKSLHPVDLPDPDMLVKQFWEIINDPKKTSVNILSADDVSILSVDGKRIIAITVPQASRVYRPVCVDGDFSRAFRRNGDGDCKCSKEEFDAMVRDALTKTTDMNVLTDEDFNSFYRESYVNFRRNLMLSCPGHGWENLDEGDFLREIGAVALGEDGQYHPTCAGMLMFGKAGKVRMKYSGFSFRYVIEGGRDEGETIFGGNVYEFFQYVKEKLYSDERIAWNLRERKLMEREAVYRALREALANCLVNADYYGEGGIRIVNRGNEVIFENPGGFRIPMKDAKFGGISDPRNSALLKMFGLIEIGESTGSGIPGIYRIWRENGWPEPTFVREENPERIVFTMKLVRVRERRGSTVTEAGKSLSDIRRENTIVFLTDHPSATAREIAGYLNLPVSQVKNLLKPLMEQRILEEFLSEGKTKYKLKY